MEKFQLYTLHPKHAFIFSGLLFMLLGFLLLDRQLLFSGNIVLALGICFGIRSGRHLKALLIFGCGFLLSFYTPRIGIMIEAVSLVPWAQNKLSSFVRSPLRLLKWV
ncbi:hypothetical protein NEDG_01348 [Nematocida displodere]|uniref:Uncharacterized protein n=1 Tax=Nematocida displodere TaxID=1805483 RepID=A0A177EBF8_9MICR|nr:hypothetical protein NEDG_01348 [Nematocida displodere]